MLSRYESGTVDWALSPNQLKFYQLLDSLKAARHTQDVAQMTVHHDKKPVINIYSYMNTAKPHSKKVDLCDKVFGRPT